ncbi:hypothetical protein ACM66B_005528 [Microbotryomycetes sp. NB124-2]
MNFLTQSFDRQTRNQDSTDLQRRRIQLTRPRDDDDDDESITSSLSTLTTTASARDNETVSDVVDLSSSVFTFDSTTSSTAAAESRDDDDEPEPFELLRTVDGDPLEQTVDVPSIKRGDVKTWSKVEARIILWNDGTLRKGALKSTSKKELRAKVRQEYVVSSGVLWVTKSHQLLFVFDVGQVPRLVNMTKKSSAASKPTSLLGSRRPSNDDESKDMRRTESIPRPVTPTDKQPWLDDSRQRGLEEFDDDGSRERMSGFKGFVSNVFRSSTRTSDDENRLQLTKTRTSENGLEMQRTRSTGRVGCSTVSSSTETEQIHLADPLPTYSGYDVRALHIANPASIVNVRYFSQTTKSFWLSPSKPVSTPSHGNDKPSTSNNISNSNKSRAAKTSESVVPACIEVDVAPVRALDRSPVDQQHGRQREVTVGFYFLNDMMGPQ